MVVFFLLGCIQLLVASDSYRVGQPIPEVRLKDGRVLSDLTIVSFTAETVMAKWKGGGGTIRFSLLPDDIQDSTKKFRVQRCTYTAQTPANAVAPKSAKRASEALGDKDESKLNMPPNNEKREAATAESSMVRLKGEAFIAGGTSAGIQVKFTGLKIYAYPLAEALSAFEVNSFRPDLPKPLAFCVSDSEGRWTMLIPKGTAFLLRAEGQHYATKTGHCSDFEWRIKSEDIQDLESVMLTSQNSLPSKTVSMGRR
jgi:hypothetical protein